MQVIEFESKTDWSEFRKGKITGSIANDVFVVKDVTTDGIKAVLDKAEVEYKKSAPKAELLSLVPEEYKDEVKAKLEKKLAFYELLAHKVAVPEEGDEMPLDRGTRLEGEAVEKFAENIGRKVSNNLVVWVSDANSSLAYSPDGVISDEEVVEVKCLSSAHHLYIYYEKDIPTEYKKQNLQAFIVNEKLQKLYFVLYDPRIPNLPLHYITIKREDVAEEIELYKRYEIELMKELEALVTELTF